MPEHQSDTKADLVALALWRQILVDRGHGDVRPWAAYASLFPGASNVVQRELEHAASGLSTGDVDQPGAVVAHYRLDRLLGRGGQAQVWRAIDLTMAGREVALKLISLTGRSAAGAALRLRREIELMARVDVRGVCPVYDTGQAGDFAWIAMRLVPGRTLAQYFRERGDVPDASEVLHVVRLIERCARVVHRVHECGVAHRDLKPTNMMVDGDETTILDFGVARALEGELDDLTATGLPVGTPAYMAPEQVRGSGAAGAEADVWALGVILYEGVTGQRPFRGATTFEVHRRIVDGPSPNPRHANRAVSRDLRVVLDTALAKDPHHRYRTAEALADDLLRILERRPVIVRPAGPLLRTLRFAQRRPGVFGLLVALALVTTTALCVALILLGAAERELLRADRATRFVDHLSDQYRLRALIRELEEDLAIDSRQIDRFAAFDARANELLARRQEHQDFLVSLRSQATQATSSDDDPNTVRARHRLAYFESGLAYQNRLLTEARSSGDPAQIENATAAFAAAEALVKGARDRVAESKRWSFPDAEAKAMHDQIDDLVHELDDFAQPRPGRSTALAARVLSRAAAVVRRDSIDAHAAAWSAACQRIEDPSGPYHGLRMAPQEGLVPLGPDPETRLEEFAHVVTGRLPVRGSAGILQYEPESALVLVLLPGGLACLGPQGATDAAPNDDPGSLRTARVPLDAFFCGKHEVTQAQWFKIMWSWSARHQYSVARETGERVRLLRNPVEMVSLDEAALFARRLGLQLPSEAQWEYACRAGSLAAFSFGEDARQVPKYGKTRDSSAGQTSGSRSGGNDGPAQVGGRAANAFGLHDMHGNVGEWTADLFGSYALPFVGPAGLRQPDAIRSHVVRGGSFALPMEDAACYERRVEPPQHVLEDVGLRVVRMIDARPESGNSAAPGANGR